MTDNDTLNICVPSKCVQYDVNQTAHSSDSVLKRLKINQESLNIEKCAKKQRKGETVLMDGVRGSNRTADRRRKRKERGRARGCL